PPTNLSRSAERRAAFHLLPRPRQRRGRTFPEVQPTAPVEGRKIHQRPAPLPPFHRQGEHSRRTPCARIAVAAYHHLAALRERAEFRRAPDRTVGVAICREASERQRWVRRRDRCNAAR